MIVVRPVFTPRCARRQPVSSLGAGCPEQQAAGIHFIGFVIYAPPGMVYHIKGIGLLSVEENMSTVKAFKAVRPARGFAQRAVIAHSQNKSNEAALAAAKDDPYSFLHVCRIQIDLPPEELKDPGAIKRRTRAKFAEFLREGIYEREESPCIYIYRMSSRGYTETGVTACVSIMDYLRGAVKRHEHTRVERVDAQIGHIESCGADIEPVLLIHRADPAIKACLRAWTEAHAPVYDIEDADEVRHTVWIVDEPAAVAELESRYSAIDSFYIGDGHHRIAAAAEIGRSRGEGEAMCVMASMFPDDEMHIYDYNRAVRDICGMDDKTFIGAIRDSGFTVEALGSEAAAPARHGEFTMLLSGIWYRLVFVDSIDHGDMAASIDTAVLQDHLLGPILGIRDPRSDERLSFISGIGGMAALKEAVNGPYRVAFAVSHISMEEIIKVADRGLIMPPKSTYFEPKPAAGLLIHEK